MSFIEDMKSELDNEKTLTENGAVGYKTTGRELLDLNFKLASLRKFDDETIYKMFLKAFYEDKLMSIKWLFFARDIRGGVGERKTVRVILKNFANNYPEIVRELIPLIPFYGRYDDLLCLVDTEVNKDVLEYISETLKKDRSEMRKNHPISLISKWLPSENASSKKTRELSIKVMKYLGMKPSKYRKMLSSMRKYIDVVERKMSANEWGEINYEGVPSKSNLLYKDAFLKHDQERRTSFLADVKSGKAKVNSATNFPHDIVHKYFYNSKVDDTIEELWKALPDYVNGTNDVMFVRDGSGSMWCDIDKNSGVQAIDVSTALAIYFSERQSGEFKDKFITFSSEPEIVDMKNCKNLLEKIRLCKTFNDYRETDIEKVFDLILKTATNRKLSQDELPKTVLIVSDMEFNSARCCVRNDATLFEEISEKYKDKGYKLPRLAFWNVNSRSGAIPIKENESGVALISGFSPAVINMVLSNEVDPYEALVEQLNSDRYKVIEEAVADLV